MRTPEKGNPSRSATLAGLDQRGASNTEANRDLGESVAPTCPPETPLTARSGRGLKASASLAERTETDTAEPAHAAPAAGGSAQPTLPCLSSNNCTDSPSPGARQGVPPALSQQHKKAASALAWNVQFLAEKHGVERIGFLTLTFKDHVLCPKEAQKRFHSLSTHVLRERYIDHIRVSERQKSGRLHYHLLVVLRDDIRTGCDFQQFAVGDYRSASSALRAEWKFWRVTAARFRFGRTELLPVKSTGEGIARYVGKYISKAVGRRNHLDHGARLVEYSRGARIANTKFAWASNGATAWRKKVGLFAQIVAFQNGIDSLSFSDLSLMLGPRWAHRHRSFIAALPEERP